MQRRSACITSQDDSGHEYEFATVGANTTPDPRGELIDLDRRGLVLFMREQTEATD